MRPANQKPIELFASFSQRIVTVELISEYFMVCALIIVSCVGHLCILKFGVICIIEFDDISMLLGFLRNKDATTDDRNAK